jgi:hypothetical protein
MTLQKVKNIESTFIGIASGIVLTLSVLTFTGNSSFQVEKKWKQECVKRGFAKMVPQVLTNEINLQFEWNK